MGDAPADVFFVGFAQCLEAVYSSDRVSEEVVMSVEETLKTNPAVQKRLLQVRDAGGGGAEAALSVCNVCRAAAFCITVVYITVVLRDPLRIFLLQCEIYIYISEGNVISGIVMKMNTERLNIYIYILYMGVWKTGLRLFRCRRNACVCRLTILHRFVEFLLCRFFFLYFLYFRCRG